MKFGRDEKLTDGVRSRGAGGVSGKGLRDETVSLMR